MEEWKQLFKILKDSDNPVMSEPPFDGNIIHYQAFRQSFDSSIMKNTRLSDEQRFTHLKRNLTGRPRQQMERFLHSGDNLLPALNLLDSYYLNKDYRLEDLLAKLENTRKVPNNSVERLVNLNTLVTEFAQYLWLTHPAKLANVNSYLNTLLVRYPPKLADPLWRATKALDNVQQFPQFRTAQERDEEKFRMIVFELNTYTEQQNRTSQQEHLYLRPSDSRSSSHERPNRSNFSTYSGNPERNPGACAFCRRHDHKTHQCNDRIDIDTKRRIAKDAPLCFSCLAPWIPSHSCSNTCTACRGNHHATLCTRGQERYRSGSRSNSRGRTNQRYDRRRQSPEYRGRSYSGRRDSRGRDGRNGRSPSRFSNSRSRDRYNRSYSRDRTGSSFRGRVKSGDAYPSRSPSRDNRRRTYGGNTPYNGRSRDNSYDRGRNRSNSRNPPPYRRRSSSANVSFDDSKKKDAHKDRKTREKSKSPKRD